MGAGGVFILFVVVVVLVLIVAMLTGNAGFLSASRGRRDRELLSQDRDPETGDRPQHTAVDLEQNLEDEPHGRPVKPSG